MPAIILIILLIISPGLKGQVNFCGESVPWHEKDTRSKMLAALIKQNKQESLQVLKFRAQKFWPVIEPILKNYSIPEDFKYLPLIESALIPGATSPVGAKGYWQFMPGTAREMGLKISLDKDERTHLEKSTIAACQYLLQMYHTLKSWTLAAAAYNYGIGNLSKSVRRQGEKNYYYLQLNRETGEYVYKIIALKELFTNGAAYSRFINPRTFKVEAAFIDTSENLSYSFKVRNDNPVLISENIDNFFQSVSLEIPGKSSMASVVYVPAEVISSSSELQTGDMVDFRLLENSSGLNKNSIVQGIVKITAGRGEIKIDNPFNMTCTDIIKREEWPLNRGQLILAPRTRVYLKIAVSN